MPFNEYLQQKIWSKIGAQSDAFLYRAKAQRDNEIIQVFENICCESFKTAKVAWVKRSETQEFPGLHFVSPGLPTRF